MIGGSELKLKLLLALFVALSGCQPDLSIAEEELLREMELSAATVRPSPTNAYADDPQAAALGRLLFFDEAMSSDGLVSCASCHDPSHGWSDPTRVSEGIDGLLGERHSMPIPTAGFQTFLLWDGRADSLWSQPLMAIENEVEMDFTRTEVAHFVAQRYAERYERVFGPLPPVGGLPSRAKPGMAAWDDISTERQQEIQRVFANVGKALAAYERRIECADTRFDRWARGEVELSAAERAGAAMFVRGGCIDCHSGPEFTDRGFHNIGIGSNGGEADEGRAMAAALIRDNPFNSAGEFSDDPVYGAALHEALAAETDTAGAFRTPTLRGVGQRTFFGHRGHRETLDSFLDDVYDDPHMQSSAVGQLDPEVRGVDVGDEGDMAAFLRTLDCPPWPRELLAP